MQTKLFGIIEKSRYIFVLYNPFCQIRNFLYANKIIQISFAKLAARKYALPNVTIIKSYLMLNLTALFQQNTKSVRIFFFFSFLITPIEQNARNQPQRYSGQPHLQPGKPGGDARWWKIVGKDFVRVRMRMISNTESAIDETIICHYAVMVVTHCCV